MYLYEKLKIAIIDDEISKDTSTGIAMRSLIQILNELEIEITELKSIEAAYSALIRLPDIDVLIVDWDPASEEKRKEIIEFIHEIRKRSHDIPIFLSVEPECLSTIPLDIEKIISECFYILEDTADFIAGRIEAAAKQYREKLLPPFFNALVDFADDFEYSWHTPGHAGGIAFLKSPVGKIFHKFFGEELFRSDLSISVDELGSLLDHSGPVGEAERFAAKVFGADQTYFVTNGTSTSNKIIFLACAIENDLVLIDRNCHKSLEHSSILTGAIPIWMIPERNRYGIIGPIRKSELEIKTIKEKIKKCTLINDKKIEPVYAVVTNSTYDGVCYYVPFIEKKLGNIVSFLHFDEAWYGYARFNNIYKARYAMHDEKTIENSPTVFASQSTHKLLAALSQASMIHIKEGHTNMNLDRFNESFMMHTSTSPLYPIIASCDVSAKMMEGHMGEILTSESITEAVNFRTTMSRIKRDTISENKNDWWFDIWQPEYIKYHETGEMINFCDASPELLSSYPECWILKQGEDWHGFKNVDDGYVMLDPIKVTVLCPGVNKDGSLSERGIPSALITRYFNTQGIKVEKTGDYSILFLFSIGVTKGKWRTLISKFFSFKDLFDNDVDLKDIFPNTINR